MWGLSNIVYDISLPVFYIGSPPADEAAGSRTVFALCTAGISGGVSVQLGAPMEHHEDHRKHFLNR